MKKKIALIISFIYGLIRIAFSVPLVIVGFIYGWVKEGFDIGTESFEVFSELEDDVMRQLEKESKGL